MNATNDDYVKTHSDLQWCLFILEQIQEVINRSPTEISESEELNSIRWLVKQGLKCRKEE